MTEVRSFAAAAKQIASHANALQAELSTADKDALTAAGMAGKTRALGALAQKVPSMGFTGYSGRARGAASARKFYVRYRYRKTERGSQVVLWSVPPGPQLVERGRNNGGAMSHLEFMTRYHRRELLTNILGDKRMARARMAGPPNITGYKAPVSRWTGKTQPKPWWEPVKVGAWNDARVLVHARYQRAIVKAAKTAGR